MTGMIFSITIIMAIILVRYIQQFIEDLRLAKEKSKRGEHVQKNTFYIRALMFFLYIGAYLMILSFMDVF